MTSTSTTAKRRFSFRRKAASPLADGHHKKTFWQRVYRDRYLLLLFLPCLIYYILFKYVPMWGVLISFKDFKPFIGFMGSDWVGLKHYVNFFSNPDAWRIIRNTLFLGVYSLVWCFPFPIIFALALNEVTRTRFKKFVQTISYMPHFLSAVVVCGMLVSFLSPIRGIINTIITMFGGEAINFLSTLPGSALFMWHPKSGRHWAGAPLSIWLLSVMWTRSIMKPPSWMVPPVCARSGPSHCPASPPLWRRC